MPPGRRHLLGLLADSVSDGRWLTVPPGRHLLGLIADSVSDGRWLTVPPGRHLLGLIADSVSNGRWITVPPRQAAPTWLACRFSQRWEMGNSAARQAAPTWLACRLSRQREMDKSAVQLRENRATTRVTLLLFRELNRLALPTPPPPSGRRIPRWLVPVVAVILCIGGGVVWFGPWLRGKPELSVKESLPDQAAVVSFPLTPISASPYLNTGPDAHYLGSDACRKCHADRHASFRHTGMGRSMATVDPIARTSRRVVRSYPVEAAPPDRA